MKNIKEFIKRYGIYILISLCLIFGLSSLLFRNATLDDDLYLWETNIMAQALSSGQWIGDYGVGTHGFLFKLPVALIFLLTGPSLEIATVWNVILACASLYIFYLILKKYFKKESIALGGVFLLLTSFQFFLHIPTYMREIPVIFSLLLFIYLILNKKSYWLAGLSLLLVFDAKEYVAVMILPGIFFYILWKEKGTTFWESVKRYIFSFIKLFLPTLVLLLLMIFTRVVPVNMYALSLVPGVTKGGIQYHLKHFDTEVSTINRIEEDAPSIQEDIDNEQSLLSKAWGIFKSYFGKLLYPRTFSFISVPKVIVFPSIFTSIFLLKKKIKKKDFFYVFLFCIFVSFLVVFFLRASFDRYILPILPVIFFFYIFFLKDLVKEKKKYIFTISITALLTAGGMFFEVDYVWIKVILNILIILVYIVYLLYYKKINNLIYYVITFVGCITFGVAAFFFVANGQIHYYMLWGKDFEIKKVVSYFDENERVLLNDVGWNMLPMVYRGDNQWSAEWKLEFSDWVPRKKYLKNFNTMNTFGMFGKSIESIKSFVDFADVGKIGLVVSNLNGYTFPYQDMLEEFKHAEWLELDEVVSLKNKTMYIFNVIEYE